MEKISKAISYIYHPLIIPTLGMLVLFNSGTYLSYLPADTKKWILVIVFLCTYVFPLVFISFLSYHRLIQDIQLAERQDRYIPMAVSFVLYIFCYYLMRRISVIPHLYYTFILSGLISILVTMLITVKYKISIHMVGAGGLVALIGFIAFFFKVDLQFYLGVSILIAGLTGTARIILKAHSADQVYLGFLSGFSVVLLTMVIGHLG